jgi:hypothetical protein
MAIALERVSPPATARAVGEWVAELAGEALASRATRIEEIESAIEPNPSIGKLLAATESPSGRLPPAPISQPTFDNPVSATAARLSLARDEAPSGRDASRNRGSILAGAALVSMALVAAAVIVSRKAPPTASAPLQPPTNLPTAHADPQPTTVVAVVTTAPDAGALVEAHPKTPEAQTKPTAVHGSPAKKPPTPAGPVVTKPTAAPAPPAANCSPNFTIVDGIKKIKPECL